jgi:hypothetical protein
MAPPARPGRLDRCLEAFGCLVFALLLALLAFAVVYGAVSGSLADALNAYPAEEPFAPSSCQDGTWPKDSPRPSVVRVDQR